MTTQPTHANNNILKSVAVPTEVFSDPAAYIKTVREGISGTVVKQAIEAMGGNRELFIRLLNTTSANLNRYYHKKVLSSHDSEEVLDTLRVYRAAVRIFGDEKLAREWLATPIPALAGEHPLDLFDTFEGRNQVRATLRKLEHGEFS